MESVSSAAQRGTENEEWFEQKQIVLGGQRTNAYSVATMDSAFAYYNNYLPNSPFQGKQVTATHKYSISTGTSLQPIFNKLTGSINSAAALKNSLIGTGSGSAATAVKINELFTSYGY
ncbi:hypothetical protein [Aequorivita xiaoshiensis]|uniref:Uncharacterized protein n=1 Tax=Aequorivita xiaoshiensis TaxID=2874476 RepID=A0A9X1R122_9FLAO|nr:hypothetical protein [Aequorivita xiaoshiensis]MCG2429992.1 hypothetical protein [Aequorivita xiaoshiensis]